MKAVYQEWADEMGAVSIGAIQYGLTKATKMQFPPNLGEFIACCDGYIPPSTKPNVFSIEKKLTPEQVEQNKRRMDELKRAIFQMYGAKK